MIIVYCFIGPLPNYAIDTVHQTRLFYDGPIYFIISDHTSQYIPILQKYNVTMIRYEDVISIEFNETIHANNNKFEILTGLTGREKLFIYGFERFFSLQKLMDTYNLSNVLFLELDNLLYDDPKKWETSFKDISFMFDHYDRCASGIFYVKNKDTLHTLNNFFLEYINGSYQYMTEMNALHVFWDNHKDIVQILPTMWPVMWPSEIPVVTYENFYTFNSIFDAAAIGIYLGGIDPYHTNGVIVKGEKWSASLIDYTVYMHKWELDTQGRNIPYIFNKISNEWTRVNNLHIHSKKLDDCLSKPRRS